MIQDIREICRNYNVPIDKIDFSKSYIDIIASIESMIINRQIIIDSDARRFMADLWKSYGDYQQSLLADDVDFQIVIQSILSLDGFVDGGKYLICKKQIFPSIVNNHNEACMLTDDQISKLVAHGYAINEYRIEKNKLIRDLYCQGLHPNLNPVNGQFCLDYDFLHRDLGVSMIYMIESMLSQFNLSNSYLTYAEKQIILEIING